ncbi:MAG: hypothetical protein AAGI23_05085 [Bacteroidota bacterium]
MKIHFLLTIILFSLFSLSCETEVSPPEPQTETLEDISGLWRLQSGIFVPDEEVPINPLAYLIFDAEENVLSGFSSRNELDGKFSITNSSDINIELENVTDASEDAWSALFMELVPQAEQFELTGDTLLLSRAGFSAPLEFLRLSDSTCVRAKNDEETYDRASSDDFFLKDIQLIDQCLEVLIAYGGGCGDVDLRLVGSNAYAESLPPQLGVRLVFEDNDQCEALVQRRFYFDVTDLQYPGLDELILKLRNWDGDILVNY